ncbi:MAG: transposase [Planctomycetaceae bacterium]|jgi:transposase-like protein|nr:transposase [Planctomycetaceae bacterium]
MSKKRTTYTPEFKSKVALAAVRHELTVSEIAAKYKVHSVNVAKWKSQLLERMSELFADGRSKKPPASNDVDIADLLQKVGRLTMENDYLKKKSAEFG